MEKVYHCEYESCYDSSSLWCKHSADEAPEGGFDAPNRSLISPQKRAPARLILSFDESTATKRTALLHPIGAKECLSGFEFERCFVCWIAEYGRLDSSE